jgi:hypothetical protein
MGPGTKCRDDILECGKSEPHIRCVNAVGSGAEGDDRRSSNARAYPIRLAA